MPLRGTGLTFTVCDANPYFSSLADLDAATATATLRLSSVPTYQPRQLKADGRQAGKLLVCHDYKGGYTETPSEQAYTFNFWQHCDTFVYFAHHRVTIPPSGWTTAAHRQGVKMLGTLIFEGPAEADVLRLIVGPPPSPPPPTGDLTTGPVNRPTTFPVSRHYATRLAELAAQRGFDGWLLNVECPLRGGPEQCRALTVWIGMLREEMSERVGGHAEVCWYDSVIVNGQLRWQDRLNAYNLPFFLASDSFFTNYTWPPTYPQLTAQYFLSIDPALLSSSPSASVNPPLLSKSLQSIHTGVDIWGRGSYGGGGFGAYKALTHIDPQGLGLSAALFGQAWTWESEQDKEGFNWDAWWAYERLLWLGPRGLGTGTTDAPGEGGGEREVPVPPHPERQAPFALELGGYRPVTAFFDRKLPPDPVARTFFTSFCPGVGKAWFVNGARVLDARPGEGVKAGWTDVHKQTSLGDLLWPVPQLSWEGEPREEALPGTKVALDFEDGWVGGNVLRLDVKARGTGAEDAFFRCVWVPVQALAFTPGKAYDMRVVFKIVVAATAEGEEGGVDLDLGLSVRSGAGSEGCDVEVGEVVQTSLSAGWEQQSVQVTVLKGSTSSTQTETVNIGLVIGFATEDPSKTCSFSLLLGQLTAYPSLLSPNASLAPPEQTTSILYVSYTPTYSPSYVSGEAYAPTPRGARAFAPGTLSWTLSTSLPPFTLPQNPILPDDPTPLWLLRPSPPAPEVEFAYFNIYALARFAHDGLKPEYPNPAPERATWVGTTGYDGRALGFVVDPRCLEGVSGMSMSGGDEAPRGVRFYVQGVTQRGEVIGWDWCAWVDWMLPRNG
ncbi:glycoside hydrolase family 85 protein [Coniophora puteana RWD-64-598 SS2]|uniref:Glycoside hydrolase family 85 protein n=1 Tax=Coniophora puteana (strain RWD-64-598) TaxID=741705 RepID=A0A5M3MRP4_CONPW|nr:glycoside hydrolase family 85 protein [Coniophora puteana RWD-64-598 SS2]EIW81737.1 glycoside hydrolase family 85 protein [Coniophora puteana RWD-64-598 SS2]